jgi:ABC-2 type transport system ATP-binding protein
MSIIQLENIKKSFAKGFLGRRHAVLSGVSLVIEKGEAFGLLGHNGAGKTTTMRIMLGLLTVDAGRVVLFGSDGAGKDARSRIGYLSDEVGLYPHFTADETLQFVGELHGMKRSDIRHRKESLLKRVRLADRRTLKVQKYSRGMRQRLGIAMAILHDPDMLILDEPYSGLDPIGRRELRELLLSLKADGKTILLSSHIVPDVEAVCDRVGILSDGRVRKCLDLHRAYEQKSAPAEVVVSGVDPTLFDGVDNVSILFRNPQALHIKCEGGGAVRSIVSKVYAFGGDVLEIKPMTFNLEDYLYEALAEPSRRRDTSAREVEEEEEEARYART